MTIYAFEDFEVDAGQFELRRDGQALAIEPQVFRILLLLIEARDRLVTKDELFERIWKGRFVSEAALSSRIKSVRQALGDDGSSQRFVKTLRGEGFRFVASVERIEPVAQSASMISAAVTSIVERPKIGVFPFRCDGQDAEYLVDGLAELLISELAAARWFPVLSRNATFAVARGAPDLVEQARSLKVRYAVYGRLATGSATSRLAVDLIDVENGETLLTELVEAPLAELLVMQAEIGSRILAKIAPELEGAERRRIVRIGHGDLSAWDLTLRALWALNLPSREGLSAALEDLDKSIQLDPGLPLPWSLKAQAWFEIGLNGWLEGNVGAARNCFVEMLDAARNSIDLDPRGWMGHSLASAGELWAKSAYAPARYHADEALRLNPSAGLAHHFSGCIVGFGGDPSEAVAIQECVYSVDPHYRHATVIEADLGLWHFLLDDMERALHHLDLAIRLYPGNQRARQRRIAVRARLGDVAGAKEDARWLAERGAPVTPEYVKGSYPFQNSEHGDKLFAALFAPGVLG